MISYIIFLIGFCIGCVLGEIITEYLMRPIMSKKKRNKLLKVQKEKANKLFPDTNNIIHPVFGVVDPIPINSSVLDG